MRSLLTTIRAEDSWLYRKYGADNKHVTYILKGFKANRFKGMELPGFSGQFIKQVDAEHGNQGQCQGPYENAGQGPNKQFPG